MIKIFHKKIFAKIIKIIGFAFLVIAIIVGMVLLLYKSADKELQDIVVPILGGIVGGSLTLIGVAWTIRKGDEQRKKDREQLEQDRKEEEKSKIKPYLKSYFKYNLKEDDENFQFEIIGELNSKCNYQIYLYLQNISEPILFITGLFISNKYYKIRSIVLEKGSKICLRCNCSFSEYITNVKIVGHDIMQNYYSYECILEGNELKNEYIGLPQSIENLKILENNNG